MIYDQMTLAAIETALFAGEFLRHKFHAAHEVRKKDEGHNLVTECDTESEERILSRLHKLFPSHSFLSEEAGSSPLESDVLWIIDPLDGTVNFAHHVPHFSISIAAYAEQHVQLGVVYQPMTQELFVAQKGRGAFLCGTPLSVSLVTNLDNALLATGFPYHIAENPDRCIDRCAHFLHKGLPIRRLGSAAIDLAYVAAGRFDAYWETGINPWDVAAGMLMIKEAQGMVSTWEGNPYPVLLSPPILATNKVLHHVMIRALHEVL